MATNVKYDKFAIVMLILVVLASSLMFYSENPFMFSISSPTKPTGHGEVSLYVVPNNQQLDGSQSGGGVDT